MKTPIYSIALFHLLVCSSLSANEVSTASVAESIAKDEGYQLFRFASDTAQPYQLAFRFNGAESVYKIDHIASVKVCIVAVRLRKDKTLEEVRVYWEQGSASVGFPLGHFPPFNGSLSQSEIQLDVPFLTLKGTGGDLELILRPRKA